MRTIPPIQYKRFGNKQRNKQTNNEKQARRMEKKIFVPMFSLHNVRENERENRSREKKQPTNEQHKLVRAKAHAEGTHARLDSISKNIIAIPAKRKIKKRLDSRRTEIHIC